ncbi:MAG TPA: glycosyltransferase [Coleofasciculaceae cyanobacterium]|jgi:glycosyltransferase involved in cell wall biosynthesis
MEDTAPNQSVIIMTGMHRSGTSLTASLLQSAGIYIGDRLMGENTGNAKGHFEDLDFVEFHQSVLRSQDLSVAGWTEQNKIQVQQQYLAKAQNLISARQDRAVWGWKDPRTTLFLDFWSQLIPDAKYIFIYRSPWEVIDSLFRRGDVVFRDQPHFAVQQWCNYSQAVLDFYQRHLDRSLLLEISSIIQNSELVDLIQQKFGIELRSPESLYEPTLFTVDKNADYRKALISQFFPQAIDIYNRLEQQADRSSPVSLKQPAVELTESGILQDWIDLKRALSEKRTAEKELTQTQQQLDSTNAELAQAQQQLDSTNAELTQTQQQLDSTNAELTQTQQQLDSTNAELTQTQQQLYEAQDKLSQSQKQLQIAQMQTEQLKLLVVAMESSKFWKLRRWWFDVRQKTNLAGVDILYQNYLISQNQLPTLEQAAMVNVDREIPVSDNLQYQKWLERNYPKSADIKKIKQASLTKAYQPLISLIVPVYNPDEDFLRQAIESVLEQAYPNWELCLADDCSSQPHVKSILAEYAQQDERIKVIYRAENGHICRTSNSALELATGEYIALLDHDDLLPPHALAKVVELLNEHPEADFIYSDEDKIDEQNIHKDPFFKPDWCPDSFLARMYTCHLGIYRRSLVTEVGNFRIGFEGSQDYDLVLRITEKTAQIYHIPDVLYHWRIHRQSTAATADAKPYAANAAQKALIEAMKRRKEPGKVTTRSNFPGVYTVRYQIKEPKLVSIIIPTKDLADTLDVCLKSIFTKTTYPNYEVVVIDNGSTENKTTRCFESWQQQEPERFRCYSYNVPFNYSQINNYAVEKAQGDYLLFLNNDTEVITTDWLEGMVEQVQRPSIGAVGSLLLYPDDTIQHAGVVLGIGGVAGHSHKHLHVSQPGYISQAASTNNYSAVTAACLMCRREVFEAVGGFETELAIAFNDVDLCLKIASRGYRNVCLSHVVLYHYESKSRGYENTPAKQARFAQEVNYMREKWQQLCDRDPCYNPNLTKSNENYSLNI